MEKTKKQNILFTTERLQREELSMKYIKEIFKEFTDEVTKYLRVPTPKNIEQEESRIHDSREKNLTGSAMQFVVTDKKGDFIGTCGVGNLKKKQKYDCGSNNPHEEKDTEKKW